MSDLVLELFSEEIPALMQQKAENAYREIFTKHLTNAGISFKTLEIFSGPRRITVHITDLPTTLPAKEVEIKGPKIDAQDKAIEGFCRSHNINRADLLEKNISGQLCYVYLHKTPETKVANLLTEVLPVAIGEYVWPKSMYWNIHQTKWVRPLKNILCIIGATVLPIKFGHLTANNVTFGHRFMANKELIITSFDDYLTKLESHYVILSHHKRKEMILDQTSKLLSSYNVNIKADEKLLEEVTGLVEYPNVMIGKIPEKFLTLPSEVLTSSMRTHQKYFSLFDKFGKFAPYFLFVSNKLASGEDEALITQGNEKVLSARLSDALYFYQQDLSKEFMKAQKPTEKLADIIFHAKLGTMKDKIDRIEALCQKLAIGCTDGLLTAAKICKNDLVSEMVGEFPELQGIMGYYYALQEGLSEEIATSIRDHYKPLGPTDTMPTGIAAKLALVDKLDSLASLMIAGEKATGSTDPYALRRLALGIIRIIFSPDLASDVAGSECNLKQMISAAVDAVKKPEINDATQTQNFKSQILKFFEERARFYFKDQLGYVSNIINAVLDLEKNSNLVEIEKNLRSLQEFMKNEDQVSTEHHLLNSYKRVASILQTKDDIRLNQERFENYFSDNNATKLQPEEKELYSSYITVSLELQDLTSGKIISDDPFLSKLSSLAKLTPKISDFFDNVMVNSKVHEQAENRLCLIYNIRNLFLSVANFDYL